ncbi:MAG: 23S rRNA (adenine(2503)-C(2))-methyltransferase RlmN [Verrucomicrobiae bacterium]|nr:23S rRNA (adenine(2503)-C(2))-methyltransferase RlmN [Verrucomicrobiae bacterium]
MISDPSVLRESLLDLEFDQLQERLVAAGLRKAHALPVWRRLHRDLPAGASGPTPLHGPVQRWLESCLGAPGTLPVPSVRQRITSTDGRTRKLLVRLSDGQEVETVLMGYPGRTTACISTQAGCAMGCVFCATGQMGFVRNLRAGELVAQVHEARRLLQGEGTPGLRNLVLMGMGEPLQNYEAVIQALRIACDRRGLNLGPSRISISTVGVVPGIRRLAEEPQPYRLAVSLHGASDEERAALVPANRRWPLAELLEACRHYGARTGRRILFSWTLIAGRNDTPEHARRICELLRGLNAHLNLIPLNPTDGFAGRTAAASAAEAFHSVIRHAGIPCTLRQFRGIDVDAGCGQLRGTRSRTGHLEPATQPDRSVAGQPAAINPD